MGRILPASQETVEAGFKRNFTCSFTTAGGFTYRIIARMSLLVSRDDRADKDPKSAFGIIVAQVSRE
jgi:hypothetical protein